MNWGLVSSPVLFWMAKVISLLAFTLYENVYDLPDVTPRANVWFTCWCQPSTPSVLPARAIFNTLFAATELVTPLEAGVLDAAGVLEAAGVLDAGVLDAAMLLTGNVFLLSPPPQPLRIAAAMNVITGILNCLIMLFFLLLLVYVVLTSLGIAHIETFAM